jgi:ornithine cyclodeaminase/alanine dehydrogenase-like protein (mu-crystallin family)
MSCLYLTEQDVESLLDMETAVETMRGVFRRVADQEVDNVPRVRARGPGIVLHSMCAADAGLGLVGWKQYTTTAQGALFHVALYDQQSGSMRAMIAANRLGQMRTGAVTGLAAELLAGPGIEQAGLFGSGWQAESQLAAIVATCQLKRVWVYSRDAPRRQQFCQQMSERLQVEVLPATEPGQAVQGMPLVVTMTTSKEPVFSGQWLEEGSVVCAAGSNWLQKTELDRDTIAQAEVVVCDDVQACRGEAGDFTEAIAAGEFQWEQAHQLATVVQQGAEWRAAHPGRVVFKSVGLALEDVALGSELLKRAEERGVGMALPW